MLNEHDLVEDARKKLSKAYNDFLAARSQFTRHDYILMDATDADELDKAISTTLTLLTAISVEKGENNG